MFKNKPWTFTHDGATSHTAQLTQKWCAAHLPKFLSKEEWPPSSPDINPLDYALWSVLESKCCSKPHKNLQLLKKDLQRAWADIPMEIIQSSIKNFPNRLESVVNAKGGHFE